MHVTKCPPFSSPRDKIHDRLNKMNHYRRYSPSLCCFFNIVFELTMALPTHRVIVRIKLNNPCRNSYRLWLYKVMNLLPAGQLQRPLLLASLFCNWHNNQEYYMEHSLDSARSATDWRTQGNKAGELTIFLYTETLCLVLKDTWIHNPNKSSLVPESKQFACGHKTSKLKYYAMNQL